MSKAEKSLSTRRRISGIGPTTEENTTGAVSKNLRGAMPRDMLIRRLNKIMEAGLEFHEWIWFGDRQTVRRYLKRHPEEVRIKLQSFAKFFDRAVPVKVLHQSDGGRRFSPDDLQKMQLDPTDLKRLADIPEPNGGSVTAGGNSEASSVTEDVKAVGEDVKAVGEDVMGIEEDIRAVGQETGTVDAK